MAPITADLGPIGDLLLARAAMPKLIAVAEAAVAHLDPQVPLRDGKDDLIAALAALEVA